MCFLWHDDEITDLCQLFGCNSRLPFFGGFQNRIWYNWAENGWDIEQSIALADKLKSLGVDLIDCSSGGTLPTVSSKAGYAEFAAIVQSWDAWLSWFTS